jgi:hypothetical protein
MKAGVDKGLDDLGVWVRLAVDEVVDRKEGAHRWDRDSTMFTSQLAEQQSAQRTLAGEGICTLQRDVEIVNRRGGASMRLTGPLATESLLSLSKAAARG